MLYLERWTPEIISNTRVQYTTVTDKTQWPAIWNEITAEKPNNASKLSISPVSHNSVRKVTVSWYGLGFYRIKSYSHDDVKLIKENIWQCQFQCYELKVPNYLAPGGGCEVLFSPGLSVCLFVCLCVSLCVCVCPANILVFYFSAIRRDIDLKCIQDTHRVVLNWQKNNDLHRSKVKVTGAVHCFLKVVISQKLSHRKMSFFFIDTSWDTLFDKIIKTRASREMTSQKIRQYLTLICKTPIPKLLILIKLSMQI